MFQLLNPLKAKNEFQKLKMKNRWILALTIVFLPVLLSAVGDVLVQMKVQDSTQTVSGDQQMRPVGMGPPGAMGPMGNMQGLGAMLGLFSGFVAVALFWPLKSAVFHVFSRVLGGKKPDVGLVSTIHIMAYTYLPFIFKGLLDVIRGLTYQAPSPGEMQGFSPSGLPGGSVSQGSLTLEMQTSSSDILLGFVREHNIFLIWALILMVIAVREQYVLGNRKAVLVILLPYCAAWIIEAVMMLSGIRLGGI